MTDDEGILAASEQAALAGDGRELSEEEEQRVYLLNKVRLRLSDYE